MRQKFLLFFISLSVGLFCLHHSHAQTGGVLASYDFESGIVPTNWSTAYSAFKVKVPIQVVKESNGNHFVRITATAQDLTSTGGQSSIRVRSQAAVGNFSAKEGEIVTYSFSIRLGNNAPSSSVLMQLYQYGDENLGYGATGDGTGPTVWISSRNTNELNLRNYYDCENKFQSKSLGTIPLNKFVNVVVTIYWSLDSSKGTVDVWLDEEHVASLSGAPTTQCPLSKPTTQMDIGTYGDGAVGVVDFDNIVVKKGAGETVAPNPTPTPPASGISCHPLDSTKAVPAASTYSQQPRNC